MPKAAKLKTDLGDLSDALFSDAIITIFNLMTLNAGLFTGIPVIMGAIGPLPANSFGFFINLFNTIRLAPTYDRKLQDIINATKNIQKANRQLQSIRNRQSDIQNQKNPAL